MTLQWLEKDAQGNLEGKVRRRGRRPEDENLFFLFSIFFFSFGCAEHGSSINIIVIIIMKTFWVLALELPKLTNQALSF